jgi:hypothetical protein
MVAKVKKGKASKSRRSPQFAKAMDACDLKIKKADATPDEDLPVAKGGVA